ncbi:MAG: DUF362 domain-containing protein [Ignavibacteriales bacterium]|nr:DUF362 domain-containing protein [Ignavibacteriales bacterium]
MFGFAALVWFIVRVVPKPSRITYPCQQVAASIGGGFLVWIASALASLSVYRKLRQHNVVVAVLFFMCCLTFAIVETKNGLGFADDKIVQVLTPVEGTNKPMGTAKGIYPGRVVWTQDFQSTPWDEKSGFWWQENNTNQNVVDEMLSTTLQQLTEAKTDAQAWDMLFKSHNNAHQRGTHGHQNNEKIVIKINCNADSKPEVEWTNKGYPTPHFVYALVTQLIEQAGVRGANITITDPSRVIGKPIYDKIRSNPGSDYQQITFEERVERKEPQRVMAVPDTTNPIYFDLPTNTTMKFYLPKSFTEASYIINLAQVRPHRVFGVTLSSKNLFGAVYDINRAIFKPDSLHAFALWGYPTPNKQGERHSHPVLLGHKTTYDKTFLYILDGLYTSKNQSLEVVRWSSMNNHWFSSILMSQDPIALESVGYDFIVSEPNLTKDNPSFNGNVDSHMHEAALAPNSPSGAKYDPEHDGSVLQSLGVHEHWNNAVERKYSRNLGQQKGIELVSIQKN